MIYGLYTVLIKWYNVLVRTVKTEGIEVTQLSKLTFTPESAYLLATGTEGQYIEGVLRKLPTHLVSLPMAVTCLRSS